MNNEELKILSKNDQAWEAVVDIVKNEIPMDDFLAYIRLLAAAKNGDTVSILNMDHSNLVLTASFALLACSEVFVRVKQRKADDEDNA